MLFFLKESSVPVNLTLVKFLNGAKRRALQVGWSQGGIGAAEQKTKLSMTRSIFELEAWNFAWKFVWIIRTNYKSTKVQKSTQIQKYS